MQQQAQIPGGCEQLEGAQSWLGVGVPRAWLKMSSLLFWWGFQVVGDLALSPGGQQQLEETKASRGGSCK